MEKRQFYISQFDYLDRIVLPFPQFDYKNKDTFQDVISQKIVETKFRVAAISRILNRFIDLKPFPLLPKSPVQNSFTPHRIIMTHGNNSLEKEGTLNTMNFVTRPRTGRREEKEKEEKRDESVEAKGNRSHFFTIDERDRTLLKGSSRRLV